MKTFHGFWVNEVKKKSGASFVAWETQGSKAKLKLIIDGEVKYLTLRGDFGGVTIESYADLLKQLEV